MTAAVYTIRRKVFTFLGAKFHIYNEEGALIGYCSQKAFKLKEDIRVYSDETMSDERLVINARSIIDFSAAYDVTDRVNNVKLGALRRKGMASLFRDEWTVLDEHDQEIGSIKEDSAMLAMVRRYLLNIIPQKYHLWDNDGRELAEFRTHFNPFVHRMTLTVYPDCPLNPLLVLCGGILLVAIEGRQQ